MGLSPIYPTQDLLGGQLVFPDTKVHASAVLSRVHNVGRNPTEWSGDAASEGWAEHQQEVDWAGAMQAQL